MGRIDWAAYADNARVLEGKQTLVVIRKNKEMRSVGEKMKKFNFYIDKDNIVAV